MRTTIWNITSIPAFPGIVWPRVHQELRDDLRAHGAPYIPRIPRSSGSLSVTPPPHPAGLEPSSAAGLNSLMTEILKASAGHIPERLFASLGHGRRTRTFREDRSQSHVSCRGWFVDGVPGRSRADSARVDSIAHQLLRCLRALWRLQLRDRCAASPATSRAALGLGSHAVGRDTGRSLARERLLAG